MGLITLTSEESLTLAGILNRVQVLSTRRVFTYNKMDCINSKPVLQKGCENLLEYNVSLQLHCSFCNPEDVIKTLEEQAESGEAFEWVYNSAYMGTFVIDSIEKTICNRIKDFVIYAEVKMNLLEYQEDLAVDAEDEETYSEESGEMESFVSKMNTAVKDNITAAIPNLLSDSVTDAAKELFTTVSGTILSEASGVNITTLYQKSEYWAEALSSGSYPGISDITEVVNAVKSIPASVLSSALRGQG